MAASRRAPLLAVIVGTIGIAFGQGVAPARALTTFGGWECVLDLEEALGAAFVPSLPAEVRTSRTSKVCFGGAHKKVTILCTARVPDWTLGNKLLFNVPCQISRTQCGESGFVTASLSALTVLADGRAVLACTAFTP